MLPESRTKSPTDRDSADGLRGLVLQTLFFFLPASFAYPPIVLKLLPATLCAALLLLLSGTRRATVPLRSLGFFAALALLLMAATCSSIANGDREEVYIGYGAGYLSLMLVFVAVRRMSPNYRQIQAALFALSLGAMIPLVFGLSAFYREFGIPDLGTLLNARYAFERIATYGLVTFGNVNNTAAFLAIVTPVFFCLAIEKETGRWQRAWFALCAALCLANLLIVNSRAAFFAVPAVMAAVVYFYKQRVPKSLLAVFAGGLVLLVVFLNGEDGVFWENMRRASVWDGYEDNSVSERIESIQEGLEVFADHFVFGIGPGCSHDFISLSAAHQMSIQHGVELGVFGLLGITLLTLMVVWRTLAVMRLKNANATQRQAFICLSGPLAYLLMGAVANAPVNLGAVNAWGVTVVALLAVADCLQGQFETVRQSRGNSPGLVRARRFATATST